VPTICRLLELSRERATSLIAEPTTLAQSVASAKIYTDVYRYWHAIQYLLAQHSPGSVAGNWLGLGQALTTAAAEIPAARVLLPEEVAQLDAVLRHIEPDDLIPHYEADALDQADVYPRSWKVWEETFDPLGQVLEHYYFLQSFASKCAAAGDALLLYFVPLDDGSV
jgi:uncharacterized protein DUF1877